MDVLNSIALPQSKEHFHLLLLVYNIVMIFLLPYLALLVGSLMAALLMDRRAGKTGDADIGHLARRLAGIALPDRSTFIFLVVLPSIVVVFLFVQMFQGTTAMAAGFAALGALLLIAGGTAGFVFKFTFTLDDMIALAGDGAGKPDGAAPPVAVAGFLAATRMSHRRSGNWAAMLLLAGVFLFVGASTIGLNPEHWRAVDGFFALLLTGEVWIDVLAFFAAAAGMSGAGLLFSRFVWHQGTAPPGPEDALILRTAVRLATAGILAMPLLFLLGTALIPATSLTGWVYVLLAFSFAAFGLALHFLYAFVKSGRTLYVALLLPMVVAALAMSVTKNQVALHTATADHAAQLAVVFEKHTEDLRSSLGVMAKQMTGEDIYNARCSACHLFDQKKVGPPYKEVLVKYAGKKPALIAFVLNPVKVNPAYPNMPGQGLKASEADSIATFLMVKVLGKTQ
jgi:cytochrome c